MKSFKRYARALSIFLTIALGSHSIILCYDRAFMDRVSTQYVTSFGIPPKPAEPESAGFWKGLKNFFFGSTKFVTKQFSPSEERTFAHALSTIQPLSDTVIDGAVVDKLELVKGDVKELESVASQLTNHYTLLSTELGKRRFIEILVQPTTNVALIKQRQNLLRELISNEQLFTQCRELLKGIEGKPQSLFLGVLNKRYGNLIDLSSVSSKNGPFSSLNKKTWVTTIANLEVLYMLTACVGLGIFLTKKVIDTGYDSACYEFRIHGDTAQARVGAACIGMRTAMLAMSTTSLTALCATGLSGYINLEKYLQDCLINTATCISAMQQLYMKLSRNEVFKNNFLALEELVTLNGYSNKHTDEFNTLIRRLETNTFKGSPPSFSLFGRASSTRIILLNEDIVKELLPSLNALAELDVLVALARKIKEHQHGSARYSLVEFSDKTQPYISATNFWNPLLSPEKAVPNTFTFGPGATAHNVILSGPNTGGKSTLLKAIMVNEILAHTFGIAAAEAFSTTPFTKLGCHMNITDDTTGGKSLFQAEIDRAKDLVTALEGLSPDQYAFIIIDEIFTGTAPEQAEELSCRFIKRLSQFKNCIFICASHFKKLIALEQETAGVCKNFHMGVIADAQNQVTKYTYTLTPGPSKINNAYQLAKEHGIFF